MPMNRIACEKYASLEINKAQFRRAGNIVSQTPLCAEFTEVDPCENGMWLNASPADGELNAPAAVTDMIGIVYTSEKEYSTRDAGLKNFCSVAGDYPRVGVLEKGDIFTTNCAQYDTSVFNDEEAIATQLTSGNVYIVPTVGSGVPTLVKEVPGTGTYGVVDRITTVPNGEKGIHYTILRV